MSVNDRILDPVPASAGNLWQRFTLIVMCHEYGADRRRHPFNYLLFSRYVAALVALDLTSDDLTRITNKIEKQLKASDEAHLVNAITALDYPLAEGLLAAGVMPGQKSIRAIVSTYGDYKPARSRPRRDLLLLLLQGGLDAYARVDGKWLLHHLCAGSAPAQDIEELLHCYDPDDINGRDHNGDTPLLCYCRRHCDFPPTITGLDLLLDAGADPCISNQGVTARQLLQRNGSPERHKRLVERLLEHGAEPENGHLS